MDMTCLADCGPSYLTIVLLLLAAGIAGAAAHRVRWTIGVTGPLLYAALVLFAGKGYSHAPAGWLIAITMVILILGLIAGKRLRPRSWKRSA